MLDPVKLKYLFHTAELGGVRQAADFLDVNPSTISRQIALLEQELGLRLLERQGRNVRPTEVGYSLCDYFRSQHSADLDLKSRLDEFRGLRRGKIRLSVGEGFIRWLINKPLLEFQKSYPSIQFDISIDPTAATVRKLIDDQVDIGVTYAAQQDRLLNVHARADVPICVVVAKGHPLTKLGRNPRLQDIVGYPLCLLHDDFGLQQVTRQIAQYERVELRPIMTSNSFSVMGNFVQSGQGIFLQPYRASPQRELSPDLIPLPLDHSAAVISETQIITRVGRHLTPAGKVLVGMLIGLGEFNPLANDTKSDN